VLSHWQHVWQHVASVKAL